MMAIIWRTPKDEKIYVTPSGYPLTKEAHALADKFDIIFKNKLEELVEELSEEGYFTFKNKLLKYHLLGKKLGMIDDLELLSKCDPDKEHIWRALYDYVPELAPKKMPTNINRITGKRNFFLNSYMLGKMDESSLAKIGVWSNWDAIYMIFAANPYLWEDWRRILRWILKKSLKEGKLNRELLRLNLKVIRRSLGKRAKIKMDPTVLSDSELENYLDKS